MHARWLAAVSLLFVATCGARAASRPSETPKPPSSIESLPAYFKTGILDLPTRIWAQTQIERVFYNHRIWPKENPGPKPPFETMVPTAVIEAKVTDSLKKSAALDKFWQHPVTGEMLQAELDRMAKQTRDPATLKELFEALHNDPRLIAETLARETLSDRLIRNWYAYDTRFHAEARAKADAIAARLTAGESWSAVAADYGASSHDLAPRATRAGRGRAAGAGEGSQNPPNVEYHHQTILLDDHPNRAERPGQSPDERRMDAEEFAALKKKYSGSAESPWIPSPETAPPAVNDSSPRIEETIDHFILTRVMVVNDTRIELESIVLSKVSFSIWWTDSASALNNNQLDINYETPKQRSKLPEVIDANGCDQWGNPTNLYGAPDARDEHTAVWTGTEMIIWGGYGAMNSGGRYNPATDSWLPTSTGNNVPTARWGHTAVWTGSEMIIWGGGILNSGGRYDPSTDTWRTTNVGFSAPEARNYHSSVWTGVSMIIWGGSYRDEFGQLRYLNTGSRYNPINDTWSSTSTGANTPSRREFHTAIWSGSEMIVWGGYWSTWPGFSEYYNNGSRYNPSTNTWLPISMTANVPSPRCYHTAIWSGSEMIVWGGGGPGGFNPGGRYNPASNSWSSISNIAGLTYYRTKHTSIWTGTEMIVWGGTNNLTNYNTGGRYDPNTDSWVLTSVGINSPPSRYYHTAIWTGTEMIIWGGIGTDYFNTGGRYDPTLDTWLHTSTGTNIPSARYAHTAVWTGAEMTIWGGSGGYSGDFNTGGRYIPTIDNWTLSSNINAPSARSYHTAIWTGSEMVVWGGRDSSGLANSGARYNPTTDSWIATATGANLPEGRYFHTVIWNGSEMIVWGGQAMNTPTNTGGKYNLVSDSWTPTLVDINTPAPRIYHSAIWTNSEMIIWGGSDYAGNYFSSGGRYNPFSDSWIVTSTGGKTPSGRENHTAIWSGLEMIIWGGYDGIGNTYNSGGRYSPNLDSWNSTSTGTNLPISRHHHTAIWTGSEMIVWGGNTNIYPYYTNTGGRYNPASDIWLPTNRGNSSPSGRTLHTVVWTGNNMIIWGGYIYPTLNSGGIYTSGSVPSPGNSLRGGKSSSINLNWSNIFGAGSYNVKRCDPTTTPCIPSAIISTPTINQYSEPDDGISHFYAVEAVNQCGATP